MATSGWFSLLGGIVALALTVFSVTTYRAAAAFDTQGVWITAAITEKRIRSGDDSKDYLVTFQYRVDGRQYDRERDTGRSYYDAHEIGDDVPIKILPDRPEQFEYREGQTRSSAVILQVVAGVAGVLGCALLWFSGSKANSAVLARRAGRKTVATITNFVEHKNSGKPTGRGYMIFHTEDGLRGESLSGDINRLRALGSGTKIDVFVRGKDVWWEGDVGPRAERRSSLPRVPRG